MTLGYNTGVSLSSYYHYNRGFDVFNEYISLSNTWFVIRKLNFLYFSKLLMKGLIDKEEYYSNITINLDRFFNYIKYICSENIYNKKIIFHQNKSDALLHHNIFS